MSKIKHLKHDEEGRIEALKSMGVLLLENEECFHRLTKMAASLYQAPYAFISIINKHEQKFKICHGISLDSIPKQNSICIHTLKYSDGLVVKDLEKEKRFPIETIDESLSQLKSYAGVPLITKGGYAVGTLAVGFDTVTDLSDFNIAHLTDLASIVMDEIELYGRHLIKTQSKANLVTTTELEENKKFLLSIAEVADVGGWELDLKTMAIKWNEKTSEIHEVPKDFVPDFLTAINFYVPEVHDFVRKEIRACLYEGKPFDFEVEIITYKKNRKWVRAVGKAIYEDGSIIKILGAFQDVTKIRREKQELADALNSRKEALNALSSYQSILDEHAIVSITDLDGKITFTNENFCKISGYTAHELIGEDHSKIKSDLHDDYFFEDMWKTLKADRPWRGDMCNKHKDGSVYWVDTTIIPLKDIDGNVNEYVSMRYDITEKIYHADELVQKRVEAEAANIAKSQFLATTSHEIRTPMNGVMGMLDLTLQTQLTQEQRRHLTVARNSAGNLLEVLNDILDISKLEAGKIDIEYIPFSLQTLLNEIESLFSFKAEEKGIDLRFMPLDPSVPTLIGDPTRIRQVITNLVSNAIKFTKVGYVEICVTYDKAQERISLSIEDTGIGIAEDRIDLLFQRFSQADASMTRCFGGTGLGLAISKQLIEMMGGQISVTSEEGKGSLFSFTLSAAPTSEEITSPSSHNFQDAHEDVLPLNILVADDNHVNQMVMRAFLETEGHQVNIVGSGKDALKEVDKIDFDLIFMDVQMPEMDGLTATQHIRHRGDKKSAIPIIAFTANAMAGDQEEYLANGMSDYLAKPIDMTKLKEIVRKYSDRAAISPVKIVNE